MKPRETRLSGGAVEAGNDSPSLARADGRSLGGVDSRTEVRDFLASRRARITPQQAGLAAYGGTRRVPGLRRGEVALLAGDFRTRWAAHNVRLHQTGIKHFHHPVVGAVTFSFEAMPLPSDPGLTLTALSAEPGSPTQDALKLLASWTTTLHQAETPHATKPV